MVNIISLSFGAGMVLYTRGGLCLAFGFVFCVFSVHFGKGLELFQLVSFLMNFSASNPYSGAKWRVSFRGVIFITLFAVFVSAYISEWWSVSQ